MRVKQLSISGFRGVKEPLELFMPGGFVVIAGHNGSGKSTICDAIEFALTGQFGSSRHKERGESISDYIWWRGKGEPLKRFVRLVLEDEKGEITITRTPNEEPKVEGASKIEAAVCYASGAPLDSVSRLCSTSIIRDEEITKLSVDLPETDRFDFVRNALGATDFVKQEECALAVQKIFDDQSKQANSSYTINRTRVSDLTARLSSVRSEANAATDVGVAEAALRHFLNEQSASIAQLLQFATRAVADRRLLLDQLIRLLGRMQETERRLSTVRTPQHVQRISTVEQNIASTRTHLANSDRDLAVVEKSLEEQRKKQPRLAALASLHLSGKQLGLDADAHCPLCGSSVAPDGFARHLETIQALLQVGSDITLQAERQRSQLQQTQLSLRQQLEVAEREIQTLRSAEELLNKEMNDIVKQAGIICAASAETQMNDAFISGYIERLRTELSNVERSIALLEASRLVEEVTKLESELVAAQAAAEASERAMGQVQQALQRAKDAVGMIRRVRGEIINESLAELSPLMGEFYARLRPHVDWQEISYNLRGDVRRFLSFEVGDGLNPSFVFSSGQRRAAGLAFLLAVFLARPWCRLKTLILDDPIQHVDDFRALNLTEVLASIRRSGERQIICTTQDDALAELMSRRLRSADGSEGCLVKMGYDSVKSVHIASIYSVKPLEQRVLVPA